MKKNHQKYLGVLLMAGLSFTAAGAMDGAEAANLTLQQKLGKLIYFDENLSQPAGQSCASCHHPFSGFVDPDPALPVSQGAIPDRFGNRNTPISAYAAYSPIFHFDPAAGLYFGGQFWDGRAADLAEQAKGPFLNPLEMNNPNMQTVVRKILKSDYGTIFRSVCRTSLRNVDSAYQCVADAIASYEMSAELNQFSSKFDCFVAQAGDGGAVDMTTMDSYRNMGLNDKELLGLALFNDPAKGNCAACHPSSPPADGSAPGAVFTDFSYDNLGAPANPEALALFGDPVFVDLGLGGVLGDPLENGKMKVPTMRNVARTGPYLHNGAFATLHDVINFYNTAGVDPTWPAPEVPDNVNRLELGNLGLTAEEVDAMVAFLHTLTDGYICQ